MSKSQDFVVLDFDTDKEPMQVEELLMAVEEIKVDGRFEELKRGVEHLKVNYIF